MSNHGNSDEVYATSSDDIGMHCSDHTAKRKGVGESSSAAEQNAGNSSPPDAKRSKSTPDTGWRVKLYRLNPDGSWDDCGTGRIRCLMPNDPSLCVTAEQQDGRVLLRTRILSHDVYQQQGENIITWCEPCYPPNDPNNSNPMHQVPTDVDLALSFQDNEGCCDIWSQIQAVSAASVESVAAQAAAQHHDVLQQQQPPPQPPMILTLPPPTLATLPLVADRVAPLVHQHREALALAVADDDGRYLRELLAVFPEAEESSDPMKPLATLAACIKSILLVNDVAILEMVVNDPEIFGQVCAALEFDPDLRQRAYHRWFLAARAKFRTVLPMDAPLVDAIQRSFRVQYLKDTLLRPTMDESALSTLSSLQTFTHAEVIKGITSGQQEDRLKDSYLIRLIRLLGVEGYTLQQIEWADTQDDHPTITIPTPLVRSTSSAPSTPRSWGEQQHPTMEPWKQHVAPQDSSLSARKERRKGCLAFLRELHTMVRMSLQANDKDDFFSVVSTVEIELDDGVPLDGLPRVTNLLSLLSNLLLDRVDDGEQNTILDILAAIVMHDPGLIRRHCLDLPVHPRPRPNEKMQALFLVAPKDIMAALLFLLATATDAGILLQITEILRIILDTDMVGEAPLMCPADVPEQQQQQQQAAIASATEQRKFIDMFYEHYIEWLVAPLALTILQPWKRVPEYVWDHPDSLLERLRTNAQTGRADTLIHIVAPQAMRISFAVDVLAYCIRTHVYPARAFLYKSKTLVNVAQLLQPPNAPGRVNSGTVAGDRCLKLSVVRLFRSVLAVEDECYHRIIIQNDLFAYIFRALRANPVGDNLVSSSVMDLCSYIAKEEIKPLLEYIVTQHLLEKPGLEEGSQPYVSTLTAMREWYEQYSEQKNQPLSPPSQDGRPTSYDGAMAGTTQSSAPVLTGKALEDQRRFRQADEEDSYFMDDTEGPPPSSRQPFIDAMLSRNNRTSDFRRTPRMFSMATDRPASPTSSGDTINIEEAAGRPPALPPADPR